MSLVLPLELQDGVVPVAADFMTLYQFLATAIDALGGGTSLGTANQVSGVNGAGTASEFKTLNGTTGQVTITHGTASITFALPAVVAVASALAAGTNPAASGAVRLPNAGTVSARNAANSADLALLSANASDQAVLGAAVTRVAGQLRCDLDATGRLVLPVGVDKWAV
jgi:hypothetical protein